ncbi:TIGR02679 domain-containing protein [Nonomuraea sp. NPDC003707]
MNRDLDLIVHDPDFARLWASIHERLCAGVPADRIAMVRVSDLSPAAIAELRSWLDTTTRRRRGRSAVIVTDATATVPVRQLLSVLQISSEDLVTLAERATGKRIVNRAVARREASERRQDLWAYANDRLPQLSSLVERMRSAGVSDDEPEIRRFVNALAEVISKLPFKPPISLPKLAHDYAGDPHYFDLKTLNGARLISAIAEFVGEPECERPDRVRALLASVGIIADRLSSTVLLYRVQVTGNGVMDRRLRDATTPVAVTLLDLILDPPTLAQQTLTVVENPSVLEAAMVWDKDLPLACTSGHLRGVDHAFLQLVYDQRAVTLRYAGDLDADGIHVASYIAENYGAEVVAMDAETIAEAGSKPSAVPLGSLINPTLKATYGLSEYVLFQEHDTVLRRIFDTSLPPRNARTGRK